MYRSTPIEYIDCLIMRPDLLPFKSPDKSTNVPLCSIKSQHLLAEKKIHGVAKSK